MCLLVSLASDNGDDNLILGLSVDKVSISKKISVRFGEEHKELSPFCVLMCLTLEGKLIMFHVARYFPALLIFVA